jgi:hypothetical protein
MMGIGDLEIALYKNRDKFWKSDLALNIIIIIYYIYYFLPVSLSYENGNLDNENSYGH